MMGILQCIYHTWRSYRSTLALPSNNSYNAYSPYILFCPYTMFRLSFAEVTFWTNCCRVFSGDAFPFQRIAVVSFPELCFVKFIYLFIHPFATSIALGQVRQVLKRNQCSITNNFTRLSSTQLKTCNYDWSTAQVWILQWNRDHIFVLCYPTIYKQYLYSLLHNGMDSLKIFNRITVLTWTDKTLQACKTSFSIEPISFLFWSS
jgi:hypothetical protein